MGGTTGSGKRARGGGGGDQSKGVQKRLPVESVVPAVGGTGASGGIKGGGVVKALVDSIVGEGARDLKLGKLVEG